MLFHLVLVLAAGCRAFLFDVDHTVPVSPEEAGKGLFGYSIDLMRGR